MEHSVKSQLSSKMTMLVLHGIEATTEELGEWHSPEVHLTGLQACSLTVTTR
jgi:hypothetical protein